MRAAAGIGGQGAETDLAASTFAGERAGQVVGNEGIAAAFDLCRFQFLRAGVGGADADDTTFPWPVVSLGGAPSQLRHHIADHMPTGM